MQVEPAEGCKREAGAALDVALRAWTELLGPANVLSGRPELESAARATFRTTQRVAAILRPGDRAQVQECVRIAQRARVPLYPVSRGRNWGYGSRVPVRDGSVLLELGRLDRIVDFDETLAYVTVEPGVTFHQLHDFLQQKGSRLLVPCVGASPDASLVGNVLERGLGKGPYGDRFAHVCGLEVVLPTGEFIHTGLGRFQGARAGRVHRWGVGPFLDGLFTQSNLGITTQMTLWLQPAPRFFETFFYQLDDASRLPALIDALRELKMSDVLPSVFGVYNDYKAVSAFTQFPWGKAPADKPLSRQALRALMGGLGAGMRIGSWNGEGALFCATRAQARAARACVKRVLGRVVDRLLFVDSLLVRLGSRLHRPYRWLTGIDVRKSLEMAYTQSPFLGIPSEAGLRTAYWRKRGPVPDQMDLDRDRCGTIWFSPVVPFDGAEVQSAVSTIEGLVLDHGFEPGITLQCPSPRAIDVVVAITYDRDEPGGDERAEACQAALLQRMGEAGYVPYRLTIQSMDALPPAMDDYGTLLMRLKRALDPDDILAPGRYDFRSDWPQEGGPRD
jgi:4-cresol dehydrogenase (hydroxylating)